MNCLKDDLIPRAAVVKEMNAEGHTKNMRVHKRILDIPAVEAAPVVHGRWIKPNNSQWTFADCSVCGKLSVEADHAKFCPNCGAKMDGEQTDSKMEAMPWR